MSKSVEGSFTPSGSVLIAAVAAVAAAVAGSPPVFAQQRIEEIIVTTRKRAENLQDIPLAVTAFTGSTLERKGLDGLDDVIRLIPGVQIDQGTFPQDIRIVIRGLSPTLGRQNVALLLDGVDVSSESVQSGGGSLLINPRLFDMERIEIVKGPQSALYGRSAFAGAVNYITKKPTNEFEGRATVQAGQRSDFEGTVGVYGPAVPDRLFLGLNAAAWNFDGFYDNTVTGADLADNDGFGVAGSAIFNLSDAAKFTARLEHTDDHIGQSAATYVPANSVAPIPPAALGFAISPAVPTMTLWRGPVPDARRLPAPRISEDPQTGREYRGSDRKITRIAGTLEWDFDAATLTSLTHYAAADLKQAIENTRQGSFNRLVFATTFKTSNKTRLFSQEFNLRAPDDASFRWLVGGVYWQEKVDQNSFNLACLNNRVFPGLPFIPCGPLIAALAGATPDHWVRDTDHWSAFGMFEFDVTEQLTLHAEGRYVDEDLFVSGPSGPRVIDSFGLAGPPTTRPPATPSRGATDADSYFTPRFSVEYQATDDAVLYASVARGAKPSGIATTGAGAGGFDPDLFRFQRESMWVYEVGAKSTWADGRVVANAAAYYEDFSGKQTTSQILRANGLLGTLIVNASAAEVKGFEADLAWAATENLNLSAGYALVDSKYKRFVTNTGGPATIAAVGNCRPVTVGTSRLCEVDRSGNELEDVSKHSLVLGAAYTTPLTGDIDWLIETDVQYRDNRFDESDNVLIMPGYWRADLRVGLTSKKWEVVAYANNVFNDDTVETAFANTDFSTIRIAAFPPPFTFVLANSLTAQLPDKRQIGVRALYRF
ncbi:MAG: TonB-dependent receptor [Alphaproteobacteria bacterium]|nr:TonB-dependent receptor [Alphaproteobacteria bacterium]